MTPEGKRMSPDAALLDELVRRMVEAVHPRRIILFGSAARGTMAPEGDLDLLVVVPDSADCRAVARDLYRRLRGLNQAKDLVVVRQGDLEKRGADPNLVFRAALTEGKELYHDAS
jgi:predicted nucleotidyltransferase